MLLFTAALVVALNILPALMPPHRFTARWGSGGFVSRFGPACLGCGAIFFAIVALQGILLQVVPGRWFTRVSTFVQAAVVCISFTAGLASWFIVEQGPAAASMSPFVLFAAP
jgi:hypothetical protein